MVVAGGLTWWLQEAAEPPRPAGWEETRPSPAGVPEDWMESRCPLPEIPPDVEDGVVATACLYAYDTSGGVDGLPPLQGSRSVRQ